VTKALLRVNAGALRFEDAATARRWCGAEAQNLGTSARFALAAGYLEHAVRIPQLVGEIWLSQGRTVEVLNIMHAGLVAAKALGESAGYGGSVR
jgi:hypothetical protein